MELFALYPNHLSDFYVAIFNIFCRYKSNEFRHTFFEVIISSTYLNSLGIKTGDKTNYFKTRRKQCPQPTT